MSEIGDRLRRMLDETDPADLDAIVRHEPVLPLWRVMRAVAYAVVALAVVGVTVVLALSGGMEETAGESSTTSTVTETTSGTAVTTVPDETATPNGPSNPPLVSSGWALRPGDILVANDDGVQVLRGGQVIAHPVASPVETALADGTGGIVFVAPDPDRYPAFWPDPYAGGGRVLWRASPDGTVAALFTPEAAAEASWGDLSLHSVDTIPAISDSPSALVTRTEPLPDEPGFDKDRIYIVPVDGSSSPIEIAADTPGEGGVTGLGWLGADGGLVMSTGTDAGAFLELWTLDGKRVEWPANPVGSSQGGFGFQGYVNVAAVPGSSLVAYIQAEFDGVADLVVFDTTTDTEVHRVSLPPVGSESPRDTAVKQITAGSSFVVINRVTLERAEGDVRWIHTRALVYDLDTGILTELPIGGIGSPVGATDAMPTPTECRGLGGQEVVPWVDLPAAVEETRVRLIELAAVCDLTGLAEAAATGTAPFEYTMSHRFPTPDLFWSALQDHGTRPMGALVEMLSGPHTSWETSDGTVYAWPPPGEWSNVDYEPWVTISADGEWLSYVIPDRLLPEEWIAEVTIEGTRGPYTFDETQSYDEFGPLLWHLVTTVNGTGDIPHGPAHEWVEWGWNWAGHQPDDGPYDVYGVTDLSAVDVEAVANGIPIGTTVVLREVRWSLDQLEDFKDALNAAAPDNGICSTGLGAEPNRIRITATNPTPDLGDVPRDAVWLDEVNGDGCPGVFFGAPLVPFHLYVSNQGFEMDPVRLQVLVDGTIRVDEYFEVLGQHNWKRFDLVVPAGPHELRVVAPQAGVVSEQTFELTEESWAVVNFWSSADDPSSFDVNIAAVPPVFF